MVNRSFLFVGVLAASFALPMLLTNPHWSKAMKQPVDWLHQASQKSAAAVTGEPVMSAEGGGRKAPRAGEADPWPAPPDAAADPSTPPAPFAAPRTRAVTWPPVGGPPAQTLADVVRFDATPQWMMGNWSRVARLPFDNGWQVYRVPLATGSQPFDVCGSLTYVFDAQPSVQRVSFDGWTGDPSRVIDTAVRFWNMAPDATYGPGLYLGKVGDQVLGVLQVGTAQVMLADRPQERYQLKLELNRAGSKLGLSEEMTGLLNSLKPPVVAPAEAAGSASGAGASGGSGAGSGAAGGVGAEPQPAAPKPIAPEIPSSTVIRG